VPLRTPAYVADLLAVDPTKTESVAAFAAQSVPELAERTSGGTETPQTAFRQVRYDRTRRGTRLDKDLFDSAERTHEEM
jgi:hypothetical protein